MTTWYYSAGISGTSAQVGIDTNEKRYDSYCTVACNYMLDSMEAECAHLEKPCVLTGGHYHGVLLAFVFFSFHLQVSMYVCICYYC